MRAEVFALLTPTKRSTKCFLDCSIKIPRAMPILTVTAAEVPVGHNICSTMHHQENPYDQGVHSV